MHYRREIDGLRAVAVVPVILFHAGFEVFSGGFVGVDVFFVISGYLITSLLMADLEAGNFSILRFYERRARRILPALFTVMAVCIPFAWVLMLPNRFKDFLESVIAVVFFGSNILFWRQYGYFEPDSELKPLLHTWSLSVEEQFYLLFPLLLWVLWRFGKHRVLWVLVGIAGLSLLLCELGWRYAPTANFFLAPTRAWELLAGSICAFVLAKREPRSSNILSLIGLTLIVVAIFHYDERTPFPSVYALAPVGGTALIVLFAGSQTLVARLLSSAGFVGIGLVSYSAYLWHQPIFAFVRLSGVDERNKILMAGMAGVAFLLAWLTWAFVERPFRKYPGPILPKRWQVFAASGAAGLVFVAIGLAGYVTNGFENRLSPDDRALLQYADYPVEGYYRKGTCLLTGEQAYTAFEDSCWTSARSFIIGDSHAAAFAAGIDKSRQIGQLTQTSCPPVIGYPLIHQPTCTRVTEFWMKTITDTKPDVVYLHAAWIEYWYKPTFQKQLDETLTRIAETGSKIVIIGNVPRFYPNLPELLLRTRTALVPGAEVRLDLGELRAINQELRLVAERHEALFWDPIDSLCTGDECLAVISADKADFKPLNVALVSFDNGHMTYSGAVLVADRFFHDIGK